MEKKLLTSKEKQILSVMQMEHADEVLYHYPFRYETIKRSEEDSWQPKDRIVFEAKLSSSCRTVRYGRTIATRFELMLDSERVLHATIFNRSWISRIALDTKLTVFAKYEGKDKVTVLSYNTMPLKEQEGIIPVYSLKEGVTAKAFTALVRKMLDYAPVNELIPASYRQRYRLTNKKTALHEIHFPQSEALLHEAKRYLKYEEFLRFQLIILLRRQANFQQDIAYQKQFDFDTVFRLANCLSFSLTTDQLKAVNDILSDLSQPRPMYRLIQGDVGCGKTVVAALALYANVLAKAQGALMVPTEILAVQQYHELCKLLQPANLTIRCLYGAMKPAEKKQVLQELAEGTVDIIVGTHALIQDSVVFHRLGLIVTDEQHRFGVNQRSKLKEKGYYADFLVMSATPIPRTLAGVLYGDMDISLIETQPPGRKPILTKLVHGNSMLPILTELLQHIDQGERCYVICPAIEGDNEGTMRNVMAIGTALKKELQGRCQTAVLHGKMTGEEKTAIMEQFRDGQIQILISTTVVEVGVSVKEACLMVIYNADRFGLSQLHQLRGRVKRGDRQGICYLLSSAEDEDTLTRLTALVENENGFTIADIDLKLRGPGDLLGLRQSGIPAFRIGDIVTDQNIIRTARKDAQEILESPTREAEALLSSCNAFLAQNEITD